MRSNAGVAIWNEGKNSTLLLYSDDILIKYEINRDEENTEQEEKQTMGKGKHKGRESQSGDKMISNCKVMEQHGDSRLSHCFRHDVKFPGTRFRGAIPSLRCLPSPRLEGRLGKLQTCTQW